MDKKGKERELKVLGSLVSYLCCSPSLHLALIQMSSFSLLFSPCPRLLFLFLRLLSFRFLLPFLPPLSFLHLLLRRLLLLFFLLIVFLLFFFSLLLVPVGQWSSTGAAGGAEAAAAGQAAAQIQLLHHGHHLRLLALHRHALRAPQHPRLQKQMNDDDDDDDDDDDEWPVVEEER